MSRPRSVRRAFALPLVALLSILAGIAVTLLLERQSFSRLAMKRQEVEYQGHHMLAGMKGMIEVWLMLFRRTPAPLSDESVIGFDVLTKDDVRMEIRLSDIQGSILKGSGGDDVSYLDIASQILTSWGADGPLNVRNRGPAKISIHTASAEVLEAMVLAIDPNGNSKAFADAVLDKRAQGRIVDPDLPILLQTAGLSEDDRNILQVSFTTDPSLWLVVVTVRSSSGKVVDRQGGMAVGPLRSSVGSGGGWTMLTWGPMGTAEPAGKPAGALSPSAG